LNIKEGDLVVLNSHTPDLVGIVVAVGVVENRMYGDGFEYAEYADVKWFHPRYGSDIKRFSPPQAVLTVISDKKILDKQ